MRPEMRGAPVLTGVRPPTSPMEAPAVSLLNLTKTYSSGRQSVTALYEVSLVFGRATFTAVMGPSGSGKSTLLHCAAGLDRPTSGSVRLGEIELAGMRERELTRLRRARIGFVFQAFNLLPQLTVEQNAALPLRLAGRRPDRAWLAEVIARVGLAERRRHRPAQLSGGQQQRVVHRLIEGVHRWIVRHPLAAFIAWFFTVGQALAFAPIVVGKAYGIALPAEPFVVASTLVGLLLPTFAMTWMVEGHDGVRLLWQRTRSIRLPLGWYIVALLGVPLATLGLTVALYGVPAQITAGAIVSAAVQGLL